MTKMVYFVIFITHAPKYSSAHTDKNGHILPKNLAIQKKFIGTKTWFLEHNWTKLTTLEETFCRSESVWG